MIYGHNSTIHVTQRLDVEVDHKGRVVSVWFRCCALPFHVTVVDRERVKEMIRMSADVNERTKLNAVDVESRCSKPPEGWYCTRQEGHDGPCAALPTQEQTK